MPDPTIDNEKSKIGNRKGGPRTAEGKRRSSLNNLKHGLYAESRQAIQMIACEVGSTFDQTLERMRDYIRPADPIEDDLTRRIARCSWRLAQAEAMERRLTEKNPSPGRPGAAYEKLMKFERLVDIHLHRALQALSKKRELEIRYNQRYELPPSSR